MTGDQQMAQALADAAPPLTVDTIDRLRRILATPAPGKTLTFPAKLTTGSRRSTQSAEHRRAA